MNEAKRQENEKKFATWETLADGGRRYSYEVKGRLGSSARYIKEVDRQEVTLRFCQEIYNEHGELIEVHEKFPTDKGHQKVKK